MPGTPKKTGRRWRSYLRDMCLEDIADEDLGKLLVANGAVNDPAESRPVRLLRLEFALYGNPARPPQTLRRLGVKPVLKERPAYEPPNAEERLRRKEARRKLQREQKKEKRANETIEEYEERLRKRRAYEAGRRAKKCC